MSVPVMSMAAGGARAVRGAADDLARQLIDDTALPIVVKQQLLDQAPIGSVAWNQSRTVKVAQSGASEWWNGVKYKQKSVPVESDVRFRPAMAVTGSRDDAVAAAYQLQERGNVPQAVLNAGTDDTWLVGRVGNEGIVGDAPFNDLSGFFAARRGLTSYLDQFEAVVDRGQVINAST